MLERHQVDSRELLEGREPLVAQQRTLVLILVDAQASSGVESQISSDIRLLQISELAQYLSAEGSGSPLGRIGELAEDYRQQRAPQICHEAICPPAGASLLGRYHEAG